jgi:hypothetical protein
MLLTPRVLVLSLVCLSMVSACRGGDGGGGGGGGGDWDGRSMLLCGGNQVVHISKRKIEMAEGPVVTAGGNCQLTIDDCDFKSARILSVGGDAKVTVKGGHFEATNASSGAAPRMTGTDPAQLMQNAQRSVMKPGTAVFAGGHATLVMENVDVSARVALTGGGDAHTTVKGGKLQGSETAVEADGNMAVVVQGAKVEGQTRSGGNGRIEGVPKR